MSNYNGWTNKATWDMSVILESTESTYLEIKDLIKVGHLETADDLEQMITTAIYDELDKIKNYTLKLIISQYVANTLITIDWAEIWESFKGCI